MLTIKQAADRLAVSRSTVYRMMQARGYRARLEAGENVTVPESIRPYLDSHFPEPVRITERNHRLREADLDQWLQQQGARHGV